jgi:hypothetical protein
MDCNELFISFLFPPSDYVSGITVFKRIAENNRTVDVLQSDYKSENFLKFNEYVDKYVNDRIIIDMGCRVDWTDCIFEFTEKGLDSIKKDYKKIYSRSWLMANHFLASEYKFSHQDVFWTAEFSDPLIYDLNNNPKNYREMVIDDEEYVLKVNNQIRDLNEIADTDFPLVENNVSAYYVAEYLVYLFADRIIFTNENQCSVMLDQFPVDVRKFVSDKIEIRRHPTLGEEFYNIETADLELDESLINMAYFGNDYYSKRHFESLFYAVEALNHEFKDKLKIYLFISDDSLVKRLLPSERFIVKKPLGYLEFLNATTQFDVLIVNDVITKGNYEINPYLPSKLSDYLGSGSDIWALYEKGSSLYEFDLKYKSDVNDFDGCLNQLANILDDFGYGDENYSIDEDYMNKRFTDLNELFEHEFRRKQNLQSKIKELKKEKSNLMSSNSWKITKPLRYLKNKK